MPRLFAVQVMLLSALLLNAAFHDAHAQQRKSGESRQFSTAQERLGGLSLGLPEKDIPASLPCPPTKSRETYEGATGDYVQTWKFPACGVVLKMSSAKPGGAKQIADITVTRPSELTTARGIRIGSTEREVLEAYGRYRDREGASKKGRNFVAGSIYDGLMFEFRDGEVVRIFLGAAAE